MSDERAMTMLRPLGILVVLALALGGAAPVGAAPRSDAAAAADAEYVRSVVGRAAAHVEAGRYAQALAVLDEAERTRPHAVFMYVRATIEERRGDCARASALYLRFLELDVPEDDAADARRGVARCRGDEPSSEGEPPVDPSSPEVALPGEPSSPSSLDASPRSRPWIADPWGGALVGPGAVALGVGLGLHGQSRTDARASRRATSLQSFDELSRRAVALDRASIATLVVGSALLVGGALRYVLVATRSRRKSGVPQEPRATLSPAALLVRF